MAQVQRSVLDGFNTAEELMIDRAQTNLAHIIKQHIAANTHLFFVEGGRGQLLDELTELITSFTKSSAQLTSNLNSKYYNYLRAVTLENLDFRASMLDDYNTEGTVTYIRKLFGEMEDSEGADIFVEGITTRLGYDMKRAAGDTVFENGFRDTRRPLFARIPAPGCKCRFCQMLASRGFVYRNAKTAGEDGHYHSNCRCKITPNWEDSRGNLISQYQDYDPDALYDEWKQSDHYDYMTNRRNK